METRGDVLVWGLWERHNDTIIDVRFVYSDTDTYKHELMYKLMACWEKQKKDKYSKGGIFICLFFLLVVCLEIMPWSCLRV